MKAVVIALLLLPALGAAQSSVYRWVGPDGSVHFSDTPRPGAEAVEVAPVQLIPSLKQPAPAEGETGAGSDGTGGYRQFSFTSPRDDEAIRANGGNVNVSMKLEPELRAGHRIKVILDGEPMGGSAPLSFQLPAVARGTHTLAAEVVDENGDTAISAGPVTFHVLRVALGGPAPTPANP